MTQKELIELMADALSGCSEMLNGRDQMLDAIGRPGGLSTKSPLTVIVDDAMTAWRDWNFGPVQQPDEVATAAITLLRCLDDAHEAGETFPIRVSVAAAQLRDLAGSLSLGEGSQS